MIHPQTNVKALSTPHYRGLTDDQCRQIHCASLEILERTGVQLYYQPAIDLMEKAWQNAIRLGGGNSMAIGGESFQKIARWVGFMNALRLRQVAMRFRRKR